MIITCDTGECGQKVVTQVRRGCCMSQAISKCRQSKGVLWLGLLLSVLGILGAFSFYPALSVAQTATFGRIEVTALANASNVSSQCFGVATNEKTSAVYFLQPSGGAMVSEVPPGTYQVVVTLDAGSDVTGTGGATMFGVLRITVVAGKVSRETVALAAAFYPGAFGGGTPGGGGPGDGQGDGPGDRPWGDDTGDDGYSDSDGFGDDDYYDSGGYDDHDGRPRNDRGKGQDREDDGFYDDEPEYFLPPNGDVILKWTARYKAVVTEDSHYLFADTYAFAPGGTDTTSGDNLEIVFSGTYTWRVTGVTDNALDLEEVSGQLNWSGSGSGRINEIEKRTIQCYKDKARFLQPYDKQVEYARDSTWVYTVQKPMGISPPFPLIYTNGWYIIRFSQVHDLGVSMSGKTVYKQEECEGTDTETSPIDSPGGPASGFCDLTVSDAFNSEEFRNQLRGDYDSGVWEKAFTVSGHGTWNLDHRDSQTDPGGLGQSQYESHGVVDISCTLSFVPTEPVIPVVPLVPPEEPQIPVVPLVPPEGSGSDSDKLEWPVVPLVPPEGSGSGSDESQIPVVPLVPSD